MITVTRLDGVRVLLNDELIETIQQTPDTMVSLVNGQKLLVRDTPDELVQRVIEFKQRVRGWARL
jgi:flagellar protein FlbD